MFKKYLIICWLLKNKIIHDSQTQKLRMSREIPRDRKWRLPGAEESEIKTHCRPSCRSNEEILEIKMIIA